MIKQDLKVKKIFLALVSACILSIVLLFAVQQPTQSFQQNRFKNLNAQANNLTQNQFNEYWREYGLDYIQRPYEWVYSYLRDKDDTTKYQDLIDGTLEVWNRSKLTVRDFNELSWTNQINLKNYFYEILKKGLANEHLKNLIIFKK